MLIPKAAYLRDIGWLGASDRTANEKTAKRESFREVTTGNAVGQVWNEYRLSKPAHYLRKIN